MLVFLYDTGETDAGGGEPVLELLLKEEDKVMSFVQLLRAFGYEDTDGSRYEVAEVKVEHGDRVVIYLTPGGEPPRPFDDESPEPRPKPITPQEG